MTADPQELRQRPHFVYRAFGARRRLLYVGCTSNLPLRMTNHRSWAAWWTSVKRWQVDGPFDYATARQVELEAIKTERPKFNLTGRVPNYQTRRRASA